MARAEQRPIWSPEQVSEETLDPALVGIGPAAELQRTLAHRLAAQTPHHDFADWLAEQGASDPLERAIARLSRLAGPVLLAAAAAGLLILVL